MDASRRRVPGELVFALAMLLFGVTALWLAWRIAGLLLLELARRDADDRRGRDERLGAGRSSATRCA